MKILIVDDDATCRLLMQGFLKGYGQTHQARNGQEALAAVTVALAADAPYDLICLDIQMPEMDGQEALRQIREQEKGKGLPASSGAKIVMTTALADLPNYLAAQIGFCDEYLHKPVQREQLRQTLHELGLLPGGAGK